MTSAQQMSTAGWWRDLPAARAIRLDGPTAELIALSVEPLPHSAPAIIRCLPTPSTSLISQVTELLDQLQHVAIVMFPAWLPGAANVSGRNGAGVDAARALAIDAASRSAHFGPFLSALASAALAGTALVGAPPRTNIFPAEVRAAGLCRVLADAYQRSGTALLVETPDGLAPDQERTLAASMDWLAHHGRFSVWLTGAPLETVDRIERIEIRLPEQLQSLATEMEHSQPLEPRQPTFPAPAGTPHPASAAEQALEAALEAQTWSSGRAWNHTYQSHALANTFRLDLFWPAERLVVEIDGADHRGPMKYASDRRRDTQLALDGYTVVRFTNAHVLDDIATVTSQIERLIRSRRPAPRENRADG